MVAACRCLRMKTCFLLSLAVGGFVLLVFLRYTTVQRDAGGSHPRIDVRFKTRETMKTRLSNGDAKKVVEWIEPWRRAAHLQHVCRVVETDDHPPSHPATTERYQRQQKFIILDRAHGLAYCPIEKVASSFWKRVFVLLRTTHNHTAIMNNSDPSQGKPNVFDMSGVLVHRQARLEKVTANALHQLRSLDKSLKTFLFVRDPYERLFSGFIDKLFTPTYETATFSHAIAKVAWSSHPRGRSVYGMGGSGDSAELSPFGGRPDSGERNQQYLDPGTLGNSLPSETTLYADFRPFREEQPHSNDSETSKGERLEGGWPEIRVRHLPNFLNNRDPASEGKFLFSSSAHHPQLRRCPRSVTFEDFVLYVIKMGSKANEHFRSMSDRCPACALRYNLVGKLETFRQDVYSILMSAGINPHDVIGSDADFGHDSDENILRDVTSRTFSVMMKYGRCMARREILRRTWVTFQVRGFLSFQQPFPLSAKETNSISKEKFLQLVKHAYANSGPPEARKQQRKTAMMEAFYRLPAHLLSRLESVVKADCQLFDYECSVQVRFPRSKISTNPDFRF